jgi:uncharacterized membrane protein
MPPKTAQVAQTKTNVGDLERLVSGLGGGLLVSYGLRHPPVGLLLAVVGGELLYRAVTGYCPIYGFLAINTSESGQTPTVSHTRSVTVQASPAEAYRFWRNIEQLPRFMKHLEAVEVIDDRHSQWVAKGPLGTKVTWNAEIFLDKENELIAWRSLPNAQVVNAGSVRFLAAPGNRGCEVKVTLTYAPPAGKLGSLVASLFGEEPGMQITEDLTRFKQVIEAGEVAMAKSPRQSQETEQHS